MAKKAPKSYLNRRRPTLMDALALEGDVSLEESTESLRRKGYFTPRPRPWKIGMCDRGLGRASFAILDRFGDLVAEMPDREHAELVVEAVNQFSR